MVSHRPRSGCQNYPTQTETSTQVESLYLCAKREWEWRHDSHCVCAQEDTQKHEHCFQMPCRQKADVKTMYFLLGIETQAGQPFVSDKQNTGEDFWSCEVQPLLWQPFQGYASKWEQGKSCLPQPRATGRKSQKVRQERVGWELMELAQE